MPAAAEAFSPLEILESMVDSLLKHRERAPVKVHQRHKAQPGQEAKVLQAQSRKEAKVLQAQSGKEAKVLQLLDFLPLPAFPAPRPRPA